MRQNKYRATLLLMVLATFLLMPKASVLAIDQGGVIEVTFISRITEGLKSPLRIAIDDQDIAYVTDAIRGRICRYDTTGKFLGEFEAGSSPLAVAVNTHGYLYVGDRISGELQLFDGAGNNIAVIDSGFQLPTYATIDDEKRLYVVDGKKKSVSIFDAQNRYLASFGDDVLIFPTGIVYDKKNQRILVTEHGGLSLSASEGENKMIHAFDKQGQWLESFGDYGIESDQIARIQGAAVDRWGNIYVADTYQGHIAVLDEKGKFLATVGNFGSEPGQFQAPMDVAIDSRNCLWVTSMNTGSLEIYDLGEIRGDSAVTEITTPPTRSELLQNYPNPFNPGTWIPFVLAENHSIVINIYNQIGQLIRRFDLGERERGNYSSAGSSVYWDGTNHRGEPVASGIYLYEIRSDDFVAVRRMLLLK